MSRGSIRKRGTAWELRFDVPSANGARRTRSVAFKGSRQEAQRELTKLLAQADAGHPARSMQRHCGAVCGSVA